MERLRIGFTVGIDARKCDRVADLTAIVKAEGREARLTAGERIVEIDEESRDALPSLRNFLLEAIGRRVEIIVVGLKLLPRQIMQHLRRFEPRQRQIEAGGDSSTDHLDHEIGFVEREHRGLVGAPGVGPKRTGRVIVHCSGAETLARDVNEPAAFGGSREVLDHADEWPIYGGLPFAGSEHRLLVDATANFAPVTQRRCFGRCPRPLWIGKQQKLAGSAGRTLLSRLLETVERLCPIHRPAQTNAFKQSALLARKRQARGGRGLNQLHSLAEVGRGARFEKQREPKLELGFSAPTARPRLHGTFHHNPGIAWVEKRRMMPLLKRNASRVARRG